MLPKAPRSSNWVFPRVIKWNAGDQRMNNWVQKNNVLPPDGNKANKVFNWGLKCSAINTIHQHRAYFWNGGRQGYDGERAIWECNNACGGGAGGEFETLTFTDANVGKHCWSAIQWYGLNYSYSFIHIFHS